MSDELTELLSDLKSDPGAGADVAIQPEVLSQEEGLKLDERMMRRKLEEKIQQGLSGYYEAGRALQVIRDLRLYREDFDTFEDYCREWWNLSRSRVYRLIRAAETVDNLLPVGNILQPDKLTERAIRPLTRLEPEQQRQAWALLLETEPESEQAVTAAKVEAAVRVVQGEAGERVSGAEKAAPIKTPRLSNPEPSNEMYTPMEWVDRIVGFFGEIDLDPSADPGCRVPAKQHYRAEEDGLNQPWFGRVYCNPPYSPVGETSLLDWSRKVLAELEREEVEAILLLLPGHTAEAWWHVLAEALPMVLQIRGRLTFEGQASAARFPSVLVYFGADEDRFARCFGSKGSLLKVMGWDEDEGESDG